MSIYILTVFSSLLFPFVSSTIQARCNGFQSTTPRNISSWTPKTTSPTASTPGSRPSYMTPTTPSTPTTHPSTPKSPLPITACSMTLASATTISGESFPPTSYCACNDGWVAGIGTTVGIDKSTTYTCEVNKTTLIPLTTVAPTNVPGKGGLPGCAAIISTTGTSAYCNCGGTPAPTLSPTASGFINCAYTIQPSSSYNPAIPTALPFAPGRCNVQVWQRESETGTGPDTFITVKLTDAKGMVIGHNSGGLTWGETLETDSKLPLVILVTPRTAINNEMIIVGPVSFAKQPSMIQYPQLPDPSGEKSRKRLRSSSHEHNTQYEKLQTVGLFDKKNAKKKEGKEAPQSTAPEVTSKPPAPTVTSDADEHGTQSRGDFSSLFTGPPKPTKTSTSIEKGKEIDHILNTSSRKPYEMLGIADKYNEFNASTADKKTITNAFRRLSRRVHPDKNEDPRATKAFQKLNKAMKRLGMPSEAFAENAYSSASDPLTDESDDIDGYDQDGDIPMKDIPAQGTMPRSYHVKMYQKCTPYIHQLINDPRNHEAALAIDRCNEKLKVYNKKHGMHRKECCISYAGLVVEVVSAQEITKSFGKTQEHSDKKYRTAQEKIGVANQNIKKWVTSNHYPREWMVQFQLTRSAELERTMAADSDTGDESTVNSTPEPTVELQHADTGDESISTSGSEASRTPCRTTDGQIIKTYHAMSSYLGGARGCTVVVQPDEEKAIGVILPGSKIGKEVVKAFLNMPNKPPDYGIQSKDFQYKDARYIDKVTFVGLRLNDDIIDDPEHCDAVCEVSLVKQRNGRFYKWERWLRWNKFKEVMGEKVAYDLVVNFYSREGTQARSKRIDNVRSKKSIAKKSIASRRNVRRNSPSSSESEFKSPSRGRRAIASKSNWENEDPDIEYLEERIASLQLDLKRMQVKRRERRSAASPGGYPRHITNAIQVHSWVIMIELTKVYAVTCAVMAILPILLRALQKIAWVAHQRLGSLVIRYLALPLVFPRARFFGSVTWLRLCFQMGYLAVNIVTNVLGARSLRDTGDRSASLSTINFSLLLASQPALIADLMGLSLRTYLHIHSTVSMVTTAQILTHFLILLIEKQISVGSGTQLYGLLAAVAIGLIVIFLFLRRPCYELFIKSHHALTIVAFCTIWRHTPTENAFIRYYLLGGAAAFIVTLVIHGISMLLSNISVHRPLPRTIIIPQKDSVTLQVSNIQPFKVRAGQFFQLRIPGVSVWSLFQNHPFAVAWWEEDENGCATSLSFLVQVRTGFTAKLLRNASSNAAHLTWVDGPYGVPLDLRGYGCTVMFATGIGIAAQISYVKEILKQRWRWQSSMRNITLAWEVEHSSQLDWVRNWMQELLKQDQGGYMLRIYLFMPNNTDAPSKYGIHDRIEILPQNMNVGSLIDEEIKARSGKMLITAATHKTRDEVRFAIMERTSASGLLSDQPAIVSPLHDQRPRMEVYISNMQANMKDLIRSSREDPKDRIGQKVDKLVHSIQVFHRHVHPVSNDLNSRVHSIDLAELLFQPSRSYTMSSRRDV
ncbi:uncharacterized protein TRUGW13939_07632 [Talaromyces rugulosus]|uniref:J domain-containing protein n=1 Tax=Talaromyces rugulosus TaxID=121627 RepID=A0A7H8R2L1_TALRU|nr:uncharacterized protein TRUGW13939_07632 [Talaromyces rugulosus]QKX60487.1 hypothetical protein TRUGW13939_07632 [Talaromyces rugulosus]